MYTKNVVKIGGNENYAKFFKRKGKLPLSWRKQGNYPVITIYGPNLINKSNNEWEALSC